MVGVCVCERERETGVHFFATHSVLGFIPGALSMLSPQCLWVADFPLIEIM